MGCSWPRSPRLSGRLCTRRTCLAGFGSQKRKPTEKRKPAVHSRGSAGAAAGGGAGPGKGFPAVRTVGVSVHGDGGGTGVSAHFLFEAQGDPGRPVRGSSQAQSPQGLVTSSGPALPGAALRGLQNPANGTSPCGMQLSGLALPQRMARHRIRSQVMDEVRSWHRVPGHLLSTR